MSEVFEQLRIDLCKLLSKYRKMVKCDDEQWAWWEYQFHELIDEMKEELMGLNGRER